MKKNFTSILRRLCVVVLAIIGTSTNLVAIDYDPLDLGELELGEEYVISKNFTGTGFFTPTKDGVLNMVFEKGQKRMCLFDNAEFSGSAIQGKESGLNANGYDYNVTAGTTYYLKYSVGPYDTAVTFILYMDGLVTKPFKETYYAPQTDGQTMYNLTTYDQMFVRFSRDIASNQEAKIVYTSNGGTELTKDITSYTYLMQDYLYIRMGEVLKELLQDKSDAGISANAPFTVMVRAQDLLGQYCTTADAEGWMSYSYICGFFPTEVVSTEWPEEFLSYWPLGDPSGIARITYSAPIKTNPGPVANLIIGDIEGEFGKDYWRGTCPVSVDGNTVIVDMTGVRRSYNDILNGNTAPNSMLVQVAELYDTDGQEVVSNAQGNRAKYIKNLPFVNLEKTGVFSDWTPVNGSNLADYNEIEVWIQGLNTIMFDGFTIECTTADVTNTILVPMAEVKIFDESSNGDEAVFNFSIPAAAKTADAVKVYPTNLLSLNGYDYSVYVQAVYNAFTTIVVNPAQGADLATLQDITVEAMFNYMDKYPEMFVTMAVVDENPVSPEYATVMEATPMAYAGGIFSLSVTDKMKLYLNHNYNGVFTAYANEADYKAGIEPIGTTKVLWYGTTPAYTNSSAVLESITPEEGTYLEDMSGVFVLTFDSQVRIDTDNTFYIPFMMEPTEFSTIVELGEDNAVSPEDGLTYSTQWELTINPIYLSYPEITLVISAIDTDGRVLEGNMGIGEDSYFQFKYTDKNEGGSSEACEIAAPETAVYEVYTLSGIHVLTTTNAADFKTLAPAIYIINGKKVKL